MEKTMGKQTESNKGNMQESGGNRNNDWKSKEQRKETRKKYRKTRK